MTRSLLRHHLRPGMTKAEVLALLGPPDGEGGANSEHLRDEDKRLNRSVLLYALGAWSGFRMDEDFLSVIFDNSDRVVAVLWWQS